MQKARKLKRPSRLVPSFKKKVKTSVSCCLSLVVSTPSVASCPTQII